MELLNPWKLYLIFWGKGALQGILRRLGHRRDWQFFSSIRPAVNTRTLWGQGYSKLLDISQVGISKDFRMEFNWVHPCTISAPYKCFEKPLCCITLCLANFWYHLLRIRAPFSTYPYQHYYFYFLFLFQNVTNS